MGPEDFMKTAVSGDLLANDNRGPHIPLHIVFIKERMACDFLPGGNISLYELGEDSVTTISRQGIHQDIAGMKPV